LGAAKKIAAVASALSTLGHEVVLVNSAHNATRRAGLQTDLVEIKEGVAIQMVTLPTYGSRPLGKARNILQARSIAREVARTMTGHGAALLWIYNGYAFECRFALEFIKVTGCPLVVELEDLPFARKRPMNIKPRVDDYYLQRVLPLASLVTCVNDVIPGLLGLAPSKSFLFPGIVDAGMIEAGLAQPPFVGPLYTAGYFGNLSVEKGADCLLALAGHLPPSWRLVVTGAGPLAHQFAAYSSAHPDRLRFIHNASDREVVVGMLQCDVIINPHTSIGGMGNGIFPFKVIEALASGRLVISTPLPACGLDLKSVVLFVEHGAPALRAALVGAERFYHRQKLAIQSISQEVRSRYSEASLADEVRRRFFHA
jgi:glycosyltransferase involved in cell wall biosynthesis